MISLNSAPLDLHVVFFHCMFAQLIRQSVCTFFLKVSFFSGKHKYNHSAEKKAGMFIWWISKWETYSPVHNLIKFLLCFTHLTNKLTLTSVTCSLMIIILFYLYLHNYFQLGVETCETNVVRKTTRI